MRTSRDQGALDTSILYQSRKAQKCYLAMAAMRPTTPAVGDPPLTRIRRPGRLCSGRVPIPLPKANPGPSSPKTAARCAPS